MASIVLIAAIVSLFAALFLTTVYMVSAAERARYPLALPVARPLQKRRSARRPVPAIAVTIKPRPLVPHVKSR